MLSLSSGIMFCILIFLFAKQELEHDRFHEKGHRIFRFTNEYSNPEGGTRYSALHDYKYVDAIRQQITDVESVTAFKKSYGHWLRHEDKLFKEDISFVDSTFLEIFSFDLLAGNPANALDHLNSVILSQQTAEKFFGKPIHSHSEFLGKMITFPKGKEKNYVVTGILKNIPETSSLQIDVLVPYAHHEPYPESNTYFGNSSIYVLLKDEANVPQVSASINKLTDNILGEKLEIAVKYFFEEDDDPVYNLHLQPLADIYLNEQIESEYEDSSSHRHSFMLSSIAILVLIISCINYIMLTTGQSLKRLKEIGMRKVLGARSSHVNRQFLGEAFLMTLISLLVAILLVNLALPLFNNLSERNLSFEINDPDLLIFFLVLVVTLSFMVGIMPGFSMNKLNPAHIFRKKVKVSGNSNFARFFVIAQFTLSIIFIIATFVIVRQLQFLREKETGFEENHVVVLNIPNEFNELKIHRLKQNLLSKPQIVNVSASDRNFIVGSSSNSMKKDEGEFILTRLLRIDPNYLSTLGIELVEGRNLSYDHSSDTLNAVLVNEAFVKAMDWQTAAGKPLPIDEEERPTIVGVVKDFHFDSMHDRIMPLAMHMNPRMNGIWNLFVKLQEGQIADGVQAISESWQEVAAEVPLEYTFLDQSLDTQYDSEERWGKIVGYAAVFTIFLSSLGLFGLTLLIVTNRTKEIGIRKAIGASMRNILVLFSKDFTKWILLAAILATPIAFYVMQKWLQTFAFKTEISWWMFLGAGLIALLIALVTIGIQIMKAAMANPVESLRYE